MAEARSLLEREMERVELRPFTLDGFYGRRDRKRRNQRIAAGIVGIAVFVAAVALVAGLSSFDRGETPAVTGPSPSIEAPAERVGFIGLPPEGAVPSAPERGQLVLSLNGHTEGNPIGSLYLYADGRLIWQRNESVPEGANPFSTGFLEQRLTPEGVELVRSAIVSTGLFEDDLHIASVGADGSGFNISVSVRTDDGMVGVQWTSLLELVDPFATVSTEQEEAFGELENLLADPESWLPTIAWEDREIRAYVPSTYSVCYGGALPIEPTRILSLLPPPAEDLLNDNGFPGSASGGDCADVTTNEARALVAAFEAAGLERSALENAYRLEYQFQVPDQTQNKVTILFQPVLPHGAF